MKNEDVTTYIVQQLKNGESQYRIEAYLKTKGIGPDEFEKLLEDANNSIVEEHLKTYPQSNKRQFFFWVILTVVIAVLFFYVLPNANIAQGTTVLSIVGAVALSFSVFHAIMFYKSWEEDFIRTVGKPKRDVSMFLALAGIPSVIFYFIISWCFTNGANSILQGDHEDAIATVMDGQAVEGRRINYADIRVSFETKDGKKVVAVEDVSTYQFKQFYKGQKLNIIYSTENPQNIDLLIDDENIRKFKNSEEREIAPSDLFHLLTVDRDSVTDELNAISYGWTYDTTSTLWMNDKRQNSMFISESQLILVTGTNEFNHTYPKTLLKTGFKATSKKSAEDILNTGEKTFENDAFKVMVKAEHKQSLSKTIVVVTKK